MYQLKMRHSCSSPRKEKYSRSPTGKYVVPHERIGRVKPNGVKQGGTPEKESLGVANHKWYPSWRQTELIPRCQRESFTPTDFEIQIWVLNFVRGVEYFKIWINQFSFARLTFLLSRRSEKKMDSCYNFKNPPYHPWINSLLRLDNNSLLPLFYSFYPWIQFPRIPDYLGGQGIF